MQPVDPNLNHNGRFDCISATFRPKAAPPHAPPTRPPTVMSAIGNAAQAYSYHFKFDLEKFQATAWLRLDIDRLVGYSEEANELTAAPVRSPNASTTIEARFGALV